MDAQNLKEIWYALKSNGEKIGPFSETTLVATYTCGLLTKDSLVWKVGMTEWAPYHQLFNINEKEVIHQKLNEDSKRLYAAQLNMYLNSRIKRGKRWAKSTIFLFLLFGGIKLMFGIASYDGVIIGEGILILILGVIAAGIAFMIGYMTGISVSAEKLDELKIQFDKVSP